ncbi:MAG: hypothetical protein LW629_00670 [Burkholderiales bacterium]|jgi:hypothetical protein|nr:hypothetical protein [Burkholderiales bacterium]
MTTFSDARIATASKPKAFVRAFLKVSRQLNFNRSEREMFLNLLLGRSGS